MKAESSIGSQAKMEAVFEAKQSIDGLEKASF